MLMQFDDYVNELKSALDNEINKVRSDDKKSFYISDGRYKVLS